MLIIDVGVAEEDDFAIVYASDERNLVYALASTPAAASRLHAQQRSNLRVFDLLFAQDEAESIHDSKEKENSRVIDLEAFMTQQTIAEVELLRLAADSSWNQIIKSAGGLLQNIKCIRLDLNSAAAADPVKASDEVIVHLEAAGFRRFGGQPLAPEQRSSLDFVRVNRYAQDQSQTEVFEVEIPYVGTVVTPKQDLVGRLLEQHLFEGPEQAFLWLYLRPGDTFFDCGAHAGVFSCVAARQLQNQGQIVGFDPNEHNLALYRQNLERLGCSCFRTMAVGLSDREGEAPFFLGKEGLSAYGTFADGAKAHAEIGQESLMAQQVTLDSVIESLGIAEVTLAKLDVEGWEVPVLLGATQAIGKGLLPVWMIEFTEENAAAAGSSTQELAKVIENFGYTLCRFDATQFRLVPEVKRSSYGYENLFAAMDIDMVNERLKSASSADKDIAKDIISRWDLASKAEEARTLSDALQKLAHAFEVCEVDCAARLEQIHTLTRWLEESNQSRQVSDQESGQTRQELEQTRQELEQTRQESEQTRQESEQTRQESEQTRQELEQTRQESEQTRQELEQTQQELDFARKPLWKKVFRRFKDLNAREK